MPGAQIADGCFSLTGLEPEGVEGGGADARGRIEPSGGHPASRYMEGICME